MTTYLIEVRNRKVRGDRWMRWGAADTEQLARRYSRALRAALGERYEVRSRRVGTDTDGGDR